MTKHDTVILLYDERCSVSEIAAAVCWALCDVRRFIRLWIE